MKINEAKTLITYLLDNNLNLVNNNQHKIAINLIGAPGIGKTAIIKEIAEERNAKYVRIELSSLEETGDLLGLPVKEYNMIAPDGTSVWVNERTTEEYLRNGYSYCAGCLPRMGYAIPSWVPTNEEEEVLVVLDDYTRASGIFMQAIMSLIQFGEYISWKLPKNTHLLLTSNEDNGAMNLTSLDSAQQSRVFNMKLDFDHTQYGAWMDKHQLKSEAINFMLLNPEIFTQSDIINARTYTMFANAITGISDWNKPESLEYINYIAQGCFGEQTNVGNLFVAFIHNNLDKLMTTSQLLADDWQKVKTQLIDNVIKDGEYRADIASVITLRLINYVQNCNSNQISKVINRILDIVGEKQLYLTEDLLFNLVRKLIKAYPVQSQKLIKNPLLRSKI